MAVTFFEPAYLVNEYSEHRLVSPVRSSIVFVEVQEVPVTAPIWPSIGRLLCTTTDGDQSISVSGQICFSFSFFHNNGRRKTTQRQDATAFGGSTTKQSEYCYYCAPPQHIAPAELLENTGCRKMTMYLSR